MAYYIKKDRNSKNAKEEPKKVSENMKPFYKILGCVIVLIIFMIIWAVRG